MSARAPTANPEPETPNSERFFTPGRFALLLGLLVFASWSDVLLGTGSFVLRDYSVFGYPLAHYHRECFWRGELPLWNPLNNCGLPFLAQWNTMTLYPGTLCYLLLPLPWSLGLFMLLHLWLGGLGAYALARRWTGLNFAAAVAGVAYAFHGLVQQSLMWPNNLAAFALLPWVILTVESGVREGGRKLVVAALVCALQMLTGAPEVILFTWVLLAALAAGRVFSGRAEPEVSAARPETKTEHWILNTEHLRFLSLAALTTLLAAAQLLPFLDLLRHSQRDASFGDSAWSLPVGGLANFLVPLFQTLLTAPGLPLPTGQNWTSSYYAGAGVLALALLAVLRVSDRRARLLALFGAVCLVLALGEHGFLFSALQRVLPLGLMRYPVKFVIPLTFILPLLAAFAVKELFRDRATHCRPRDETEPSEPTAATPRSTLNSQLSTQHELRARMARHRLRALAAVLCAVIALIAWLGWFNPIPGEVFSGRLLLLYSAAASGVFLLFTAAAMLALRNAATRPRHLLWSLAVLGLVFADLRTHLPNLTPRIPPRGLQPGPRDGPALTPAPRDGAARASLTMQALRDFKHRLLPSFADTLLLQRAGLYLNLNLLDGLAKTDGSFSLQLREQYEVEARLFLDGPTNSLPGPLADFLGVAHVSSPTNIFQWHRRPTALALITVGQRPEFAAAEIALPAMASTNWNPAEVVFLHPWDKARAGEPRAGDLQSPSVTNEGNERRLETTGTAQPAARILATHWTAHRIECEVESPTPTLVVIAQSFYHPWQATVNGQPANLLRANHAFQAVPVPAGRSSVRLEYVDRRFHLGVALTALGLLACCVLWCRAKPSASLITNH